MALLCYIKSDHFAGCSDVYSGLHLQAIFHLQACGLEPRMTDSLSRDRKRKREKKQKNSRMKCLRDRFLQTPTQSWSFRRRRLRFRRVFAPVSSCKCCVCCCITPSSFAEDFMNILIGTCSFIHFFYIGSIVCKTPRIQKEGRPAHI